MSERYSRQIRLVEVGLEGQHKIASSAHVVRGEGLAARIEVRYLAGAGVKKIEVEHERVAAAVREVDGTVEVRVSDHDHREHDPDRDHDHREPDPDPRWASDLSLPAREVAMGAYRALRALRHVLLSAEEPTP
jgi:molybdopterin/thiamine biosynthesis adenylyltransferase